MLPIDIGLRNEIVRDFDADALQGAKDMSFGGKHAHGSTL
jgi:hypothetical protein